VKRDTRRTIIWLSITAFAIVLAYADTTKPTKTTFFDWTALQGGIAELVLFGVPAILLTRGPDQLELLAIRRPERIGRTILLAVAALAGTFLLSALMGLFGDLDKEQGIAPVHWLPGHVPEFVASLFAVAVLVPIAEESYFRGAGVGLLSRVYSVPGAVVLSGCLFALMHGLVLGLVPLAFFGTMVAVMRVTSKSLLPGILFHGSYNTLAVLASLHFRFH
jgi:membrane protease YdiL (CAAX protease family)